MRPFSLLAVFVWLGSVASVSYSQVPSSEREALIAFYNSTNGDNWTIKNGWNGAAGTECDWYGVLCSSLTNSVVKITLHDNGLSGSIPSMLGSLTNLTELFLNDNSLSGSIPNELGNLTKLTYLWLHNNSLTGSIPVELGNLTNLTNLSLHSNPLGGSIPSELGNLTNLTNLSLYYNSLSGSIPAELGSLTNLTTLSLYYNSLSGSIPPELGKLTKLTSLFLNNNSLSGSIPVELGSLTKLTLLFLGDNFLTGPQPQWLSDMGIANLDATDAFQWPSSYNGVTPDSSLGLAFNNIGVFSAIDSTIYACLRLFTDGLVSSANGISQFDIGLKVVSLSEATVQITRYREFNTIGAFNENAESPDCSGKFETTTGIYTDIIQAGTSVLDTTWSLIDSTNLILKLDDYTELTSN
jgi:hypothetical protein